MKGSPPLPVNSVKWVEAIQPPLARTASASGFSRAGNAAIAAAALPRLPIGAVGMDEVVLQVAEQQRGVSGCIHAVTPAR